VGQVEDQQVVLDSERGPVRQRQIGGEHLRADRESLDRDLDLGRDVSGLDLEGDRGVLGDDQDARLGLAHDVHGDVHGDLLAALDDQQVDVLDAALQRVALDLLGDRQMVLAGQVDRQQRVRGLEREHRVVARQGHVDRIAAVPVQDGGDLVGATDAAGGALAELGALLGGNLDLGHGSFSPVGGRAGLWFLRISVGSRRSTQHSCGAPCRSRS